MEFIDSYTYDDILLIPLESKVDLKKLSLKTNLTKNIEINTPLLSAAMDTVTESSMAIAMAQQGGIGIIHKNMDIKKQVSEVEIVKRAANGIVENPVTLTMNTKLKHAKEYSKKYLVTTFPIVDKNEKVVGIITNRDFRFEDELEKSVSSIMTKDIITVDKNIKLQEAKNILKKNKIEKLLITNKKGHLEGIICIRDILNDINYPSASKDPEGRLRVGAACGINPNDVARVEQLTESGVDVIVIDTAHGHHKKVYNMVKRIKTLNPTISIIAGNVATSEGCLSLIEAGADSVKVGVGPGSICTTRIVTGVGYPQASAIKNCYEVSKEHQIPIIADGGIRYSGDIAKALALGASTVMIGSLFAGAKEAPGEEFLYNGTSYKSYRGMGSISAMQKGAKDRYFQEDQEISDKLVPEGVEGAVPLKGNVNQIIYQLLGGLKSSMGYVGVDNLNDFKKKSKFVKLTLAGYQESHVHNVMMTKEAPNYKTNK